MWYQELGKKSRAKNLSTFIYNLHERHFIMTTPALPITSLQVLNFISFSIPIKV